ncbi:MAG: NAD(P)-dependent oxidoreductase [Gammaproteobacteria bacterium]|nr:NAD(P)-dependent oxidoreductase [Gammaproteobacteria bacterium]
MATTHKAPSASAKHRAGKKAPPGPAGKAPKKIAFIGLGDMGLPMARNLVRAGYEVSGYDLSAKRRNLLKAAGGGAAKNARDSAEGAAVAFIMVMFGRQVMEAVAGENGLLQAMPRGSVIVVSATVERDELTEVAEVAAAHGVHIVDAPVSGGLPGARDGTLTFMAAGAPAAIKKIRPHLRVLGKTVHIAGENPGDGQTVKAVLQVMLGGFFSAIFESMTLGRKAGIDTRVVFDALTTSMAASPLLANCAGLIKARKFKNTGSRIATMHKDLGISTNLARRVGVPVPVASAARELFQAGISSYPDEDNWCVVKVLERMAGIDPDAPRRARSQSKTGKR